jgi:hypothetical protein
MGAEASKGLCCVSRDKGKEDRVDTEPSDAIEERDTVATGVFWRGYNLGVKGNKTVNQHGEHKPLKTLNMAKGALLNQKNGPFEDFFESDEMNILIDSRSINACLADALNRKETVKSLRIAFPLTKTSATQNNFFTEEEDDGSDLDTATDITKKPTIPKTRQDSFLDLCDKFEDLTFLDSFSLTFQDNHGQLITDNEIEAFSTGIGKMTNLKEFQLNLELVSFCDVITNESFGKLSTALSGLTQLSSVKLNFGACRKLSDVAIEQLSQSLLSLKHLGEIDFNFTYWAISDQGLLSLCETLKQLPLLSTLKLNFKGSKDMTISDAAVSSLLDSITQLRSLDYLDLNFENCSHITCESVSVVIESVQKLLALRDVNLKLPNPYGSTTSSTIGGELVIAKHANEWSFRATFASVSDNLLANFNCVIQKLFLFQNIDIYCKKLVPQPGLTDKGLASLFNNLNQIQNLQSLGLTFNCPTVTDTSLNHAADSLRHLAKLKIFSLALCGCKITDYGVKILVNTIKQVNRLRTIELNFEQCKEISITGKRQFLIELETLRQQQDKLAFDYRFRNTADITHDPRLSERLTDKRPKALV